MTKVFVSYARDDLRKVNRVIGKLKDYGFVFWQDTNNIRNGKDWPEEITKGIVDCSKFLLFMSAASMTSDNVKREVQIAYEKKRKIIILRLDESKLTNKLSYQLIGIQRTDYLSFNWESEIVSALGGGSKSPTKQKTDIKKSPTPLPKIIKIKHVSPRTILSELESAFSVNGKYYPDQCVAVLSKLENLRLVIKGHWINPSLAYNELIPRAYFLEKIDVLEKLVKDFQDTCPPGSPIKRQIIHNELATLLEELSQKIR